MLDPRDAAIFKFQRQQEVRGRDPKALLLGLAPSEWAQDTQTQWLSSELPHMLTHRPLFCTLETLSFTAGALSKRWMGGHTGQFY